MGRLLIGLQEHVAYFAPWGLSGVEASSGDMLWRNGSWAVRKKTKAEAQEKSLH